VQMLQELLTKLRQLVPATPEQLEKKAVCYCILGPDSSSEAAKQLCLQFGLAAIYPLFTWTELISDQEDPQDPRDSFRSFLRQALPIELEYFHAKRGSMFIQYMDFVDASYRATQADDLSDIIQDELELGDCGNFLLTSILQADVCILPLRMKNLMDGISCLPELFEKHKKKFHTRLGNAETPLPLVYVDESNIDKNGKIDDTVLIKSLPRGRIRHILVLTREAFEIVDGLCLYGREAKLRQFVTVRSIRHNPELQNEPLSLTPFVKYAAQNPHTYNVKWTLSQVGMLGQSNLYFVECDIQMRQ
jgi:hypothetical protein